MTKTKSPEIEKPVWLKYTEEEVKAIIQKLAKKGLTSEKIGLVLRDQYGIPKTKLYSIKIKEVLGSDFEEPTNKNLKDKLAKIISHFKKNKQDKVAGRKLMITKAKLKKRDEYNTKKNKSN
jgi:small subunit ribosomal protein S15